MNFKNSMQMGNNSRYIDNIRKWKNVYSNNEDM